MATRLRRWRLIPVVLGLSTAVGVGAAAAQPAPADGLTVGVGAGIADPFHADFDFSAFTWTAAVRGAISRHFAIEGLVTDWTHTSRLELVNQPVQGPTGIIGEVGRVNQRTRRDTWSALVNALAVGTTGRVAVSGGGGGGVMIVRRRFSQTVEDCTPPGLQGCGTFVSTFSRVSVSVQGVAGADVALTQKLRAFAQFRVAFPLVDPGSGDASLVAGVRVVVR